MLARKRWSDEGLREPPDDAGQNAQHAEHDHLIRKRHWWLGFEKVEDLFVAQLLMDNPFSRRGSMTESGQDKTDDDYDDAEHGEEVGVSNHGRGLVEWLRSRNTLGGSDTSSIG